MIDAGTSVTFANSVVDGTNARWGTGQSTQTPSAGATTTAHYYLQLQDTYEATPSAQTTWDSGLIAPTVTGTFLGAGSSSICTLTLTSGGGAASCTGWADYNLPVTLGTIGGAPASSRWEARGMTSFTDDGVGGGTYDVDYYKQYTLTVSGGNGISFSVPSQTGDSYWDSGTILTVSSNGVYDRAAGTGQRTDSYRIDGGSDSMLSSTGTVTTSVITMSSAHIVTFYSVTQFEVSFDPGANDALLSITSPTIPGDNYWYDSGVSVTLNLDGVFGRSGGTGTRMSSFSVNGGTATPVATAGTVTVLNALSISGPQSITTTTVTQYQLTLDTGAMSALSSVSPPTISGDNYWYDGGSSVTYVGDGVFGRGAGTGDRATGWSLDSGASTPVSTTGTFSTGSFSITAPHTIHVTVVAQYQITLDAGAAAALASITSPAVSGDNYWYDSGTSVTLTLNGVYGRGAGTGSRLASFSIDGGAPTGVATTGTVVPLGSFPVSSPVALTTTTLTQFLLTVNGGNNVSYSVSPPIAGDVGWYDAGASLTVSSNGVFDRASGTGQRVSSWNIDGGVPTIVTTAATVTTGSITMSAQHVVNFGAITQYQVSLDAASTAALAACTPPTIAGDDYWYDAGTPTVTCSLNGVWARSSGTGERLTSYSVDGGAATVVSTAGTVTPLDVTGISSPQSIASTDVTQYLLTLAASPASAGNPAFETAPAIAGDTGWYDEGTAVAFSVTPNSGYNFGRWLGSGACSYTGAQLTPSVTVDCAASEVASFAGFAKQPIALLMATSGGAVPEFTVTGCNAAPTLIAGDGAFHVIELNPGCSFTITIDNTGSTRYGFSDQGVFSDTSATQTSCATGTCSEITIAYFEQVQEQFLYSVIGGPGYGSPTLNCTRLGTTGACGTLSIMPESYWLDYGSSWTATNPLSGSSSDERWVANTATGQATASSLITVTYFQQFLVSFSAAPQAGGVTMPASGTSQWVNSSSAISLSASPATGYSFSSWTASATVDTVFADASSASTAATIEGPETITAHFSVALVALSFLETGLPPGTTWSATVGGETQSSDSSTILFKLSPGSYSWNVTSPIGGASSGVRYIATASVGTILVGGPSTLPVTFGTQFFLTVEVGSSGAGITLTPASGWYDQGSQVGLNASAAPIAITMRRRIAITSLTPGLFARTRFRDLVMTSRITPSH
jgi:hypothetical protein